MATGNISNKILNNHENDFDSIMHSLEAARQCQDDKIQFGSSRVDSYVEDVEDDWLETMEEPNNVCLEGNYSNSSQ